MSKPMSDAERKEFLSNLGLNPDAPALKAEAPVTAPVTASVKAPVEAPAQKPKEKETVAVLDVDPHTMPVSDIVFDPALLDEFPDLSGSNYKRASEKVFAIYRSHGRDKERNGLLHRKITEFIGQVKRSRSTGGYVKEKIKATSEERELANLLAAKGITASELAALLDEKDKA